jgi:transporter family protein
MIEEGKSRALFAKPPLLMIHNDTNTPKDKAMNEWFWYAIGAAVLYGMHQIFTRMASDHIGDGLGGFVVEATAAISILAYLGYLYFAGSWNQTVSTPGIFYSVLTGICVGGGTILFFLLFQKGGPLSAVPMILAGGAALMATAGIFFFREPVSWPRLLGIVLSIVGLLLLRN